MKRLTAPLMAIALAGVLAGCSANGSQGPVTTVELTADNMAYSTKELILEKGKTYKLIFKNTDRVEHDFSVEQIPVKKVQEGHSDHGAGKGAALHVHAAAGKTESVEFTPTEAGTYTFACTVAGHREAGMVGKVVVN